MSSHMQHPIADLTSTLEKIYCLYPMAHGQKQMNIYKEALKY